MALRPELCDFERWLGFVPTTAQESDVHQEVLDAALDIIERRCLPVDPVDYPQPMRTAVLLQASRYLKRKDSPEGVIGFGDEFGPVRVAAIDPDVESLISAHLSLDGFA